MHLPVPERPDPAPAADNQPPQTADEPVFRVQGALDSSRARALVLAIDDRLAAGSARVHIDLCDLTHLGAEALQALADCRRRARARGAVVSLHGVRASLALSALSSSRAFVDPRFMRSMGPE